MPAASLDPPLPPISLPHYHAPIRGFETAQPGLGVPCMVGKKGKAVLDG